MENLQDLIYIFTHNKPRNLILSIVMFISILLFEKLLLKYILPTIRKLVKSTKNTLDDNFQKSLENPIRLFIIFFSIYIPIRFLAESINQINTINLSYKFLKISIVIFLAWSICNLTLQNSIIYKNMKNKNEGKVNLIVFPFMSIIIRIIVIVISIAIIARELGFTGFIAGLGISGLAFALAAQDTFSNLFGGFAIVLDKPFSIGDWIQTNDIEGVVEDITFRSTRIRTFAKALVTVPNSKLANSNITNWTQRNSRRITFILPIVHNTKSDILRKIIFEIEEMLRNHEKVNDEVIIVSLEQLKKSSLDVYIYFYTNIVDFLEYQKVKEDINIKILEILEENNSSLAQEFRYIYIDKLNY